MLNLCHVEEHVFLLCVLGFGLAAFPAVAPIADEEFKAEGVDFHAGLETDAQVAEVHFVFLRVREEEREMAGDGEEEVVVEGREI